MTEPSKTAKSWGRARADLKAAGLLDEQRVANERKLLEEAVRAHRLSDIRRQQGETQTSLAEAMRVTQPRVSKIERGDLAHTELGTLEAYVVALGGRLEVTARFGDQSIKVK